MKIKTFLLMSALFLAIKGFTQAPGIQWQLLHSNPNADIINSALAYGDGGVIECIYSGNPGGLGIPTSNVSSVIKLDKNDSVQWVTGIDNGAFIFKMLIVNNNLYLFGYTEDTNVSGDIDLIAVKLNLDGTLVWKRNFGGSSWDLFRDVIATNDNGFLVAVITQSNDCDFSGYNNYPYDLYKMVISYS